MNFLSAFFRTNNNVRTSNVEDGLSASSLQMPSGPVEHNTQLAIFRHMVGIHSAKELSASVVMQRGMHLPDVSHNNFHFEGRAAPNLGIYNRVCHREAQAKRGFKFSTLLINSCLGCQVVVAAALTAMGAANTNHSSITAFGAINTIIAGILTYLKGSGLPNRIRWYENEWKKVREYIEQRERDFSRAGCQLDVNQVVQVVEAMYEEVKADIQNNTPEMYISVSEIRARSTGAMNPQIPALNHLIHKVEDKGQREFQELKEKYGDKVTGFLEDLAAKEEQRLKKLEAEVEEAKLLALQRSFEMTEKGSEVLEREIQNMKKEVLKSGGDFARGLESVRDGILQREADLEKSVESVGDEIAQAGIDLQKQAEQTKSDIERTTDEMRRAVDNTKRVVKVIDDELTTRN
jgi:hypothetical protein